MPIKRGFVRNINDWRITMEESLILVTQLLEIIKEIKKDESNKNIDKELSIVYKNCQTLTETNKCDYLKAAINSYNLYPELKIEERIPLIKGMILGQNFVDIKDLNTVDLKKETAYLDLLKEMYKTIKLTDFFGQEKEYMRLGMAASLNLVITSASKNIQK